MNVILLSNPRSGSTYLSKLITHGMQFNHVHYDPLDLWQFGNTSASNVLKKQHAMIDTLEEHAATGSTFIRHNYHFHGLNSEIHQRFEKLFVDKFYKIKLVRDNDLFNITLSDLYVMLTNVVHDCFYPDGVPTIRITKQQFLDQYKICKARHNNLLKFEAYDEIVNFSSLSDSMLNDSKLTKLQLSTENFHNVDVTKNISKHIKIKNYDELLEFYKSL